MPWPTVVGHAPVVARLERAARDGTLAHATLLVGPEAVGKTTIAEALAGALLDAASWPGGLAAHPDHWFEDSQAERIGIDRVRAGGGGSGFGGDGVGDGGEAVDGGGGGGIGGAGAGGARGLL